MRDRIESILGWFLVFIFLATTVAVVWQVIGRYLLDAPSSATEEIARFMLIWMGMLSTCYGFSRRMHVGVDLISSKLARSQRRAITRFIWGTCALFALLVLVYGGGRLVQTTATLGQVSPALGMPVWIVYMVVPISGILIAFFALAFMLRGESIRPAYEEAEAEGEVA